MNIIKNNVVSGKWRYNYSIHLNGSILLEERGYSTSEQKRQQTLADLILIISSSIQNSLNKIIYLENEISSLNNTLSKRRNLDGGYNIVSMQMKKDVSVKQQQVKQLYRKIEIDHNRLIRNLECVN